MTGCLGRNIYFAIVGINSAGVMQFCHNRVPQFIETFFRSPLFAFIAWFLAIASNLLLFTSLTGLKHVSLALPSEPVSIGLRKRQ